MNVTHQTHPSREQLTAYLAGKLNAAESDTVKQHLDTCDICCDELDSLPADDTIVAALRQQESDTSAAPDAVSGGIAATKVPETDDETRAPRGDGTEVPGLDADGLRLPAELRDHPRYRIVELLGRGGMGDVYWAEHKVMSRHVALKVIKPQLVQNDAAVRRFRREVQAAARLHHGNIVTAYDAEQAGDLHYLVMEYVDGVDLDEVIRQRGPLPVEEAYEYIRQTAEGLQYAHELGMVHRDIKPHNLMVTAGQTSSLPKTTDKSAAEDGKLEAYPTVKILDFGLSNFASEAAEEEVGPGSDRINAVEEPNESGNYERAADVLHQLTQMGTMMGTPDYIAPEQAQDAHRADIRSDIYSLGCTFYTLLAGKAPFGEGSVLDKIKAHTQRDAPPLSNYRDDVPQEIEVVIKKMMAKDPAERYQSPAEVAEALEHCSPISPKSYQRVSEKPAYSRRRPHVLTAVATLFLALLAAAATVFYIQTDNGVVRVEVTDPSLKVTIAGRTITTSDNGKLLTIRAGQQKLIVRQKDSDFELVTDSFHLRRRGQIALKVELLPGRVVISKDGKWFGSKPLPIDESPDEPTEFYRALDEARLAEFVRRIAEGEKDGTIVGGATANSPFSIRETSWIDGIDARIIFHVYNGLRELARGHGLNVGGEQARELELKSFMYASAAREGEVRLTLTSREAADVPLVDARNVTLSVVVNEWPKGQSPSKDKSRVVVTLRKEGKLLLEGHPHELTVPEITERLKGLAETDAEREVFVLPAQDVGAERIFQILAIIRQAGFRRISGPEWLDLGMLRQDAKLQPRINALKQIGVGLHLYHDVQQSFPPALNLPAEQFENDGQPLLSWRVHILPYIDKAELYDKFHLDEPWDSPHNEPLLAEMPAIFKTTDDATATTFLAVVGDGTAYEGKAGLPLKDFKDGTANTAYVVDAGRERAVPWTKPEDLPFDAEDPIRAFGTSDFGDVLLAVMADGAVKFIPYDTAPESLRALLTRAAGDTFDETATRTTPLPSLNRDEITLVDSLRGHSSAGVGRSCLAASADGRFLLSCGGPVALYWDIANRRLVRTLVGPANPVSVVALSADGKRAAGVTLQGEVYLWNLETGKPTHVKSVGAKSSAGIAFSPDSRLLVTASNQGQAFAWNVQSGEEVARHNTGEYWWDCLVMADNETVVIALGSQVQFWNLKSGKVESKIKYSTAVNCTALAISADESTLLVGTKGFKDAGPQDKGVHVWNTAQWRAVQRCNGPTSAVTSVEFLHGERYIIAGGDDGRIFIWDRETGLEVARKEGLGHLANAVIPLADGRQAASFGSWYVDKANDPTADDFAIRLWQLPESVWPEAPKVELNPLGRLEGHTEMVTDLAWHPDGKRAVSISHHDGEVRMWDVTGRKTLWNARVEAEQDESKRFANSAVAVSPDGLVVAVGSETGVIYLLDSETGKEQKKWPSGVLHGDVRRGIDALEFAPSGDWLAVVGAAGSPASVWDLKTGRQIPVSDKSSDANDVAFTADGKYLLTGGLSFSERRITTDDQGVKGLDQHATTAPDPEVKVFSVATSPDGKLAAYSTSHGTIYLRRRSANGSFFPSNENDSRANHSGVYSVTFTPDGRHLISAGIPVPSVQPQSSPTLIVWDIATMKPVFEQRSQDSIYRIALSPDGRTLLTTAGPLIDVWQLPKSVWLQVGSPADAAEKISQMLERWFDEMAEPDWKRGTLGIAGGDAEAMKALAQADRRTQMQAALRAAEKLRELPLAEQRLRSLLSDFGLNPADSAEPEMLIGALFRLLDGLSSENQEIETAEQP